MTVWIARLSLVAAILLAVALGVQTYRLHRERDATITARAAIQREQLLRAGWQRAAEGSQAELARIVPPLKAEVDALKKANATLAASSHWTGHGAPMAVPCVTMSPPAGAPTAAPPATRPVVQPGDSLPTVAVTPHVKIDDAFALDDAGGLYVARKVQARLSVGEAWASEWQSIEPDPDSATAIDPELEKAWKAYRNPKRPPLEIRVGIGFPGPTARVGFTQPVWGNLGLWGDLAAPVTPGGEFAAGAGVAIRVP